MDAYNVGDEDSIELKKIVADLEDDPDDFETWEKLVKCGESLEGGINRNSSSQAITSVRSIYDRFLAKFPLFFGYWKKYADLEFSIAGTEAAELVYERGVSSITNSVDLWTNYCSFKTETSHDPEVIRELFERGSTCVGLDFLAHPFWDKYIEFEERTDQPDRIFTILDRIIKIPMHQYARYFEKYRTMAQSRPLTVLVSPSILTKLQMELENEGAGYKAGRSQLEVERDLRARIDAHHLATFHHTQNETIKRWTYESEVKRPYFHVTDVDEPQLINWRKYLDFEEAEGDYIRTQFLYERCLVTCALHDEFWNRYARWMYSQNRPEEVRNIYQRAAMIFVPIAVPAIRLQWAYFEEMQGRIEVAKAIHEAILFSLPSHIETIISWANTCRRHDGIEAAIAVYKSQLENSTADITARAACVAEWARLVSRTDIEEARSIYKQSQAAYSDSPLFWTSWLRFETDAKEPKREHVKAVVDEIMYHTKLSTAVVQDLVAMYMAYLLEWGGKDAAKEYVELDCELWGPSTGQKVKRDIKVVNGQNKR